VRDLSNLAVSIAPADFGSWHDARTELMSEAKSGLKARVEAELAAAADEDELKTQDAPRPLLRRGARARAPDRFASEAPIEPTQSLERSRTSSFFHTDHEVHSFSAALTIDYNFLSK